MAELLKELYGSQGKELHERIEKLITQTPHLNEESEDLLWYKHLNLYIIYPEGLYRHDQTPFQRLYDHLDWIKDLGCNALHILPFMCSPLVDKGFDVSDYFKIRSNLGTLTQLKRVLAKSQKLQIRVFMDLAVNHISEQHEWFQKAQAGDEKYREYFLYSKEKPQFLRKYHKDAAVWADYKVKGKTVKVNIAFPELVGPIPHWRQGTDGYWYYHTYTPQQLDLNWKNPEVFFEVVKIVVYWASLGFNFRLDAIPFIGKGAYKTPEKDNGRTYDITTALQYIVKKINPECAFIVESFEALDKVINYFGTSNSRQSQLSYNFHLCTRLWISLIKKDVSYMWHELIVTNKIPTHAEWVNFLRNHDELSLAHLDEKLKDEVSNVINNRGITFREGHGISGRTYSLLGHNEKRFKMAYFLLASLPGALAIPYGDEIGMRNVPLSRLSKSDRQDTRNINRGRLSLKKMHTKKGQRLYNEISQIINERKLLRNYLNIQPQRILTEQKKSQVLSMVYKSGSSQLYIFINLGNSQQKIDINVSEGAIIAKVNTAKITDQQVQLGSYGGIWVQL